MMKSAFFGQGSEADRLDVLWQSGDRALCRLQTREHDGARHAFVAIPSQDGHASPDSIRRLTHEYDLRKYLESDWALKPLQLVRDRWPTMLLVQYSAGEPLDHFMGQPMEIGQFLRLAVGTCAALGQLHGQGLIHKDVKPAHVVVQAATGDVWLTGFGVASRLPRERQSPEPPEFIAGTLAYMAPEQTGRVNRSVDSRSDLYSLGILFYELLTAGSRSPHPIRWSGCTVISRDSPYHPVRSDVTFQRRSPPSS